MKNITIALLSATTLIVSCSSTNTRQDNSINPPPKSSLTQLESAVVTRPAPNKNIPHSLNKFESQTPYVPFNRVEETRGYGGTVSAIRVNNRGKIPDYYIFPNQQPDTNVNNKQLNISTPTWQLHW